MISINPSNKIQKHMTKKLTQGIRCIFGIQFGLEYMSLSSTFHFTFYNFTLLFSNLLLPFFCTFVAGLRDDLCDFLCFLQGLPHLLYEIIAFQASHHTVTPSHPPGWSRHLRPPNRFKHPRVTNQKSSSEPISTLWKTLLNSEEHFIVMSYTYQKWKPDSHGKNF